MLSREEVLSGLKEILVMIDPSKEEIPYRPYEVMGDH